VVGYAPLEGGVPASPAWTRGLARAHIYVFLIAGVLAPAALPIVAHRRAPELVIGAGCLGAIAAVAGIAGFVLHRRGRPDDALRAHALGVAALVCVGSFLLVPAANRKAGVRDFGGELAALSGPGDYLVVDQEGYEQILFYARLRGARRDFDDTRISHDGEMLVMETGARAQKRAGADRPAGKRPGAETRDGGTPSFAGELERAHRRVEFPPDARVLFVTTRARADRLRTQIGPSSRILLASKIYGKPYCVIASR